MAVGLVVLGSSEVGKGRAAPPFDGRTRSLIGSRGRPSPAGDSIGLLLQNQVRSRAAGCCAPRPVSCRGVIAERAPMSTATVPTEGSAKMALFDTRLARLAER